MKRHIYRFIPWKNKNIPYGYSNLELLSYQDALTFELDRRLKNNLPRYRRQSKSLLDKGFLEINAKGVTMNFVLNLRRLTVSISKGDSNSFVEISKIKVPLLLRYARKAIRREMARTEVKIWP